MQPPKELLRMYDKIVPHAFYGFDKKNRPVMYQKIGAIHLEVLDQRLSEQDTINVSEEADYTPLFATIESFVLVHLHAMEKQSKRAEEMSNSSNNLVETFTNVIDLQGLSLSHINFIKYLKEIQIADEICYPQMLGHTILLNTPSFFSLIWNVVKKFLTSNVEERVRNNFSLFII